jgi:hypothetical protein
MSSGPALDLRSEPELHAALSKVEYRLGHVVVPLLVLVNGVPVGEAEDLGHALCVD